MWPRKNEKGQKKISFQVTDLKKRKKEKHRHFGHEASLQALWS